eukprot:7964211-Ditylum_brightwellii.AAC.1
MADPSSQGGQHVLIILDITWAPQMQWLLPFNGHGLQLGHMSVKQLAPGHPLGMLEAVAFATTIVYHW